MDREAITELLEVYRRHTALWKSNSPEYKNKALRSKGYDSLLKVCKKWYPKADLEFLKKKIQSMRGTFRRELRKVKASIRSGATEDKVYVPSLWYFDLLYFTKDHAIEQEGNEFGENREESDEDTKHGIIETFSDVEEEEEHLVEADYEESEAEQEEPFEESVPISPQKRLSTSRIQQPAKRTKFFTTPRLHHIIDEYDAVAINVAAKLRKMEPTQAFFAEMMINKVVMHGLLGRLEENSDVRLPGEQVTGLHPVRLAEADCRRTSTSKSSSTKK